MQSIQTPPFLEEVLILLASTPTPEQIIEFQPSAAMQERVSQLLAANRSGTLTTDERAELDEVSRLEHFMRMLKATARQKLAENDLHS